MEIKKMKRTERVAALIKILSDQPNEILSLGYFCETFLAAKSSISEDIVIAKNLLEELDLGTLQTITGAAGGVKYIPLIGKSNATEFLRGICSELEIGDRIVPGGFIYMTDIIYSPKKVGEIGKILASQFAHKDIDYVITMETKGIPIALMTARALGVPLEIIRKDGKVTEGSIVSINYLSGSSNRIQTMSLSRRALHSGARVLIIDDFMKAGGTAKGMMDLMREFNCSVEGIGVLIATKEPENKVVDNYISLLNLESIDVENRQIYIKPSLNLKD